MEESRAGDAAVDDADATGRRRASVGAVDLHPAWLPPEAFRSLAAKRCALLGDGLLLETVQEELIAAGAQVSRAPDEAAELVLTRSDGGPLAPGGYALQRRDGVTHVLADDQAGLLTGFFHLVRLGERAFGPDFPLELHRPAYRRRMLDHWDNVDVHPVMGQVERGYAGGSIFWADGAPARATWSGSGPTPGCWPPPGSTRSR